MISKRRGEEREIVRQLKHKINDEFTILLGEDESQLVAATRLTRDLQRAATSLSGGQARFYVDMYYTLQKLRIGAGTQIKEAQKIGEPSSLLQWTFMLYYKLEGDVRDALQLYAEQSTIGQWSLSIMGIGPVIAAGLMAYIDIEKAPSVGHIWRYAGLDPTVRWEKNQERPWNDKLKAICWQAGQSFVKWSGKENDYYGKLYRSRKAYEVEQNETGKLARQAARTLREKHYRKETESYKAYSQGKLPAAQIEARAERWTVKIFLSHYHAVAYEVHYGKPAPRPYALTYLGHVDELAIPNWPMEKG